MDIDWRPRLQEIINNPHASKEVVVAVAGSMAIVQAIEKADEAAERRHHDLLGALADVDPGIGSDCPGEIG